MAPSRLRALLILSALLNIFLIASLIGGTLWLRARHPLMGVGALRIAGAELSRPDRRALHQLLRVTRQDMHPVVIEGRQARLEAAALLRAPNVDPATLAAALARARAADITMRERLEERAIPFVSALPQAERMRLADALVRRAGGQHPASQP